MNGGSDRVWKWSKMVEFPTFMGSWPWHWPWIRAWSLCFFISHPVLPVYQISSKSKKLCGRTDVQTDGNLPPIVLGRLPKFGSRPKKQIHYYTHIHTTLDFVFTNSNVKKKGFPYLLPSARPAADPGVPAVSPQVTISHPPGGRLPLISAKPAITFPATEHHRPLADTKLYCLVTEAHRHKQLARGCYAALLRVVFEPTTCWSKVQCSTCCTIMPSKKMKCMVKYNHFLYNLFLFCNYSRLSHIPQKTISGNKAMVNRRLCPQCTIQIEILEQCSMTDVCTHRPTCHPSWWQVHSSTGQLVTPRGGKCTRSRG